jgi:hypothetical protein
MRELIDKYVWNCHLCKRFKTSRDRYSNLLNSLSISNRLWIDISMNFVTRLFLSMNNLYNAILMIIYKLSKMHHYISCFSEDDETSIEEISKMLLTHVWKLHDLSIIIIFDRESQFVTLTWNSYVNLWELKLSYRLSFILRRTIKVR